MLTTDFVQSLHCLTMSQLELYFHFEIFVLTLSIVMLSKHFVFWRRFMLQ